MIYFNCSDGSLRAHLMPSKPWLIWQQFIHLVVCASSWQVGSGKEKSRVQNL